MSWLFSRALVAEYSAEAFWVGEPCALLSVKAEPQAFLFNDKTTGFSDLSRFGMTSELLTGGYGEDALTWFLAGFRAKHSALPHLDGIALITYGRRWQGSWQMSLPGTSTPKTSTNGPSKKRQRTAGLWVTKPAQLPYRRQTWAQTIFGKDIGYLHTPTTKANYAAASMQKWPGCRTFVQVFGKPHPSNQEYLMGWPAGWTAFEPLEMGRFQQWRQQHGEFSEGQ